MALDEFDAVASSYETETAVFNDRSQSLHRDTLFVLQRYSNVYDIVAISTRHAL